MAKKSELTKEEIIAVWGDGFAELADHPQIGFTETEILVELKRTPAIKTIDGEETKLLKISEPDLAALKSMDLAKGEVAKIGVLIQRCAGIPAASADKIKSADFMLLNRVLGCFLLESPKT